MKENSIKKNGQLPFVHIASSFDGSKQTIGVTATGKVYTWGKMNEMGQLGRSTSTVKSKQTPTMIENIPNSAVRGFAGGFSEAGHTAFLDASGYLWLAGCDRWQQLGLGSTEGGACGYTWEQGRIWREFFTRNDFLHSVLQKKNLSIRDVALGGDHTVILASNRSDVIVFGKGGDGQLGVTGKPFVSAPIRSTVLSSAKGDIAAICAVKNCSLTLDDNGKVLKKAGKCRLKDSAMDELEACVRRASQDGLLSNKK